MQNPDPPAAPWLRPEGFGPGVGALMSTRLGGVSVAPWQSLNLGTAVGDNPAAVAANRQAFAQAMDGAVPVYLKQVHGTRVLRLQPGHAEPGALLEAADASVSTVPGLACTVQVADCLPVLMAAPGSASAPGAVAAAHAGWRGLAGGVLEATLVQLCDAASCEPGDVQAWLGPCIGPRAFEVGADVLQGFGVDLANLDPLRFKPDPVQSGQPPKWRANLALLARDRLQAAGLRQVKGGGWCTVEDASRFFSFRRDGITGRMAAAIWLRR